MSDSESDADDSVDLRRAKDEILQSEIAYVEDLKTCVDAYVKPIRSDFKIGEKEVLFNNVEGILQFNLVLLKGLENVFEEESSETLGSVFMDVGPYLKMYAVYARGFGASSDVLTKRLRETKKTSVRRKFLELEQSAFEQTRGRTLRDFLIMPIQRVPRYRMLLEAVLKFTSENDADFERLTEALKVVSESAHAINDKLRDFESREKVLEIEKQFNYPLVDPARKFVCETSLSERTNKGPKKRRFVLFNDSLLCCENNPKLFCFHNTRVVISNSEFQVVSSSESFAVELSNDDEAFRLALAKHSSEDVVVSNPAPVWIQDSQAAQCMSCEANFTLTRRRHHCRKCGRVVCDSCSTKRYFTGGNKPKRVCDDCVSEIKIAVLRANNVDVFRPAPPNALPPARGVNLLLDDSNGVDDEPPLPPGVFALKDGRRRRTYYWEVSKDVVGWELTKEGPVNDKRASKRLSQRRDRQKRKSLDATSKRKSLDASSKRKSTDASSKRKSTDAKRNVVRPKRPQNVRPPRPPAAQRGSLTGMPTLADRLKMYQDAGKFGPTTSVVVAPKKKKKSTSRRSSSRRSSANSRRSSANSRRSSANYSMVSPLKGKVKALNRALRSLTLFSGRSNKPSYNPPATPNDVRTGARSTKELRKLFESSS